MVIKRVQQDDTLELYVDGVDGWDDFESLARYLTKSFGAVVIDRLDGICSRTWKFDIDGEEITLKHHDELGNFFVCTGEESETIKRITSDLDKRLQ